MIHYPMWGSPSVLWTLSTASTAWRLTKFHVKILRMNLILLFTAVSFWLIFPPLAHLSYVSNNNKPTPLHLPLWHPHSHSFLSPANLPLHQNFHSSWFPNTCSYNNFFALLFFTFSSKASDSFLTWATFPYPTYSLWNISYQCSQWCCLSLFFRVFTISFPTKICVLRLSTILSGSSAFFSGGFLGHHELS